MTKAVVTIVAITGSVVVLHTLAVMLCWNFVIPHVFGLPTISFLQAFALDVLALLLVVTPITVIGNGSKTS